MPIIDLTSAKQVSTMDPLGTDDEKFDFSAMKKPKIDEEEDDCEFSDTSSSEGEWVYTSNVEHKIRPEREPEWDVDSFDGRNYESGSDDREYFSDDEDFQEHLRCKRKFIESKGFFPDPMSGNCPITEKAMEGIVYDNVTLREVMEGLANLCLVKFNEEKAKNVELVKIVRVYFTGGSIRKTYITFMARECPNGELVEYQAKVLRYIGNYKPPFPILCRPSPISTIYQSS